MGLAEHQKYDRAVQDTLPIRDSVCAACGADRGGFDLRVGAVMPICADCVGPMLARYREGGDEGQQNRGR